MLLVLMEIFSLDCSLEGVKSPDCIKLLLPFIAISSRRLYLGGNLDAFGLPIEEGKSLRALSFYAVLFKCIDMFFKLICELVTEREFVVLAKGVYCCCVIIIISLPLCSDKSKVLSSTAVLTISAAGFYARTVEDVLLNSLVLFFLVEL